MGDDGGAESIWNDYLTSTWMMVKSQRMPGGWRRLKTRFGLISMDPCIFLAYFVRKLISRFSGRDVLAPMVVLQHKHGLRLFQRGVGSRSFRVDLDQFYS